MCKSTTRVRKSGVKLRGANNSKLEVLGIVKLQLTVDPETLAMVSNTDRDVYTVNSVRSVEGLPAEQYIEGSNNMFAVDFIVVKNLTIPCIIGTGTWKKLGIVINSLKN